jgi:hypothetical protein
MAGAGVATRCAALVALRIARPIASASKSAFNVSSTLPRTTRSEVILDPLVVKSR